MARKWDGIGSLVNLSVSKRWDLALKDYYAYATMKKFAVHDVMAAERRPGACVAYVLYFTPKAEWLSSKYNHLAACMAELRRLTEGCRHGQ